MSRISSQRQSQMRRMAASQEIERLIVDFGKIPVEFRRAVRPKLKMVAVPIAQDAKRRASWSRRIPGAIRISTSITKRHQGVRIRVDSVKAPHARPYEGIGTRSDTFRHPVFGDRERWVSQKSRPFLWPAMQAGRPQVEGAVSEAILEAARDSGWREGI